MTAKELIEAAKRVDGETHVVDIWPSDVQILTDYILATVRPDDDEPVTRERLEADGWYWDEDRSIWMLVKRLDLPVYQVQQVNAGFVLWTPYRILKSMGHIRRLVAALGE